MSIYPEEMPAIYQPVITNNRIKSSHISVKLQHRGIWGRRSFLHIFEHIKKYLDEDNVVVIDCW